MIYLLPRGATRAAYSLWLDELAAVSNVSADFRYYTDFNGLLARFKSFTNGYSIYEFGDCSFNVATTVAGVTRDLPVTAELIPLMQNLSIPFSFDLRNVTITQVLD